MGLQAQLLVAVTSGPWTKNNCALPPVHLSLLSLIAAASSRRSDQPLACWLCYKHACHAARTASRPSLNAGLISLC